MARKKKTAEKTPSKEKKKKEDHKKDPYDEAMEILEGYEEGNPPRLIEPED